MSAVRVSLPGAERGLWLLALVVALTFAQLAAISPRDAAYVLIAGVGVFIVFRSLLAGLALFVILTFPGELPGALGAGPTLAKPLGVVIVVSWLLLIAGDRERQVPFLPRDAPVLSYTLLALLFWALASMVWASDRSLTLHSVSRLLQLVALVFVTYSAIRKPKDLLILVWALLVGAMATSVYALANGTLRYGRLTAGIFNPNFFAAELIVAIIVATFLLVSTRSAFVRVLLLVFLATFSIAFVQTQSRSGLTALGVASVVAVVVAGPVRGRLTAIVLVVAAIGLVYYVYAAPPGLRARVTSITAGAGTASPLREDTWQIALRATGDHPVLGVGLGNFPAIESRYFISNLNIAEVGSLRQDQLVVHNTYLEVLAELGIVGLLLFIAVLASTFGRAAASLGRIERDDALTGLLARALTAATVGLFTSYVFNSGEYEKQLWLLLGMLTAAALLGRKPVTERLRARHPGIKQLAHAPVA